MKYILENLITEKQSTAYKLIYVDKLKPEEAERATGTSVRALERTAKRAAGSVSKYLKFARFIIGLTEKSR